MLDSLSELSGTRRTDLDARLQDLQIEPIGGEEKPANTHGQGQAQEIDTGMASFESLRPVGDDQFIDFQRT